MKILLVVSMSLCNAIPQEELNKMDDIHNLLDPGNLTTTNEDERAKGAASIKCSSENGQCNNKDGSGGCCIQ